MTDTSSTRLTSDDTPHEPGEALSLDALYRAHANALEAFCTRRLGSPEDGRDATHEILLRAAHSTWRGEASLRWWLGRIARNVCTDLTRRRSRELPLSDEALDPAANDTPRARATHTLERRDPSEIEDIVEQRARIDLVHTSLAALPARDRRVVELFHLAGLSYADIARLDHTTSTAVRSRLHRARRRLRHTIDHIAPRDRLWPLPALLPALGRLRSRIHQPRTRLHHTLAEHAAGAGAPLGSLVGQTTTHLAAAVIGTVGLTLGGATPPPPTPETPAELAAPIAAVHPPPDTTDSVVAATELTTRAGADAPPGEHASTTTDADTSPSSPEADTGQGPELDSPPNPTVESNTDEVASEPVQQRDSSDDDPGATTTSPDASIDRDSDGDRDHQDRGGPSAGLSCGNPDEHGPVTALACDTHESISATPADPPNSSKELEPEM